MAQDIQSLTTKRNAYEVTDPETQISADEYNTLLQEVQSLSKKGGYVVPDMPTMRIQKDSGGTVLLYIPSSIAIPDGYGLPYLGVKTYSHGKWRLTTAITGLGGTQDDSTPFQNLVSNIVNGRFVFFPQMTEDVLGQKFVEFDAVSLFQSEFIPVGEIVETIEDREARKNGIPYRMIWQKLLFFTRKARNSKEGGFPYTPSAHNTVEFEGITSSGDLLEFKFDRTLKGNKQIVRRKYKVSLLWPTQFNQGGDPIFDNAISSNWVTIEVTAKVWLYNSKETEYSIRIL